MVTDREIISGYLLKSLYLFILFLFAVFRGSPGRATSAELVLEPDEFGTKSTTCVYRRTYMGEHLVLIQLRGGHLGLRQICYQP